MIRSRILLAFGLFVLPTLLLAQGTVDTALVRKAAGIRGTASPEDVQAQIKKSGLSPDEIRQRLTSAGMKSSLLDDYLSGAAGAAAAPPPPSADVLAAIAVLNNVDATARDAATARPLAPPPQAPITIDGLPVFGLDIFRRSTNQFEPNAVGPADANYRIGPLDVLAVILTGETELSQSPEVTREGFIVIPQVGQIYVANMTLAQATQAIVAKVRQSYAGAGTSPNSPTKVYVTVARLRANQIYVIGEVTLPGSYQVPAAGTVLTALYAAGGPTIRGTTRNIEVRRAGSTVGRFDLYDYLLRGDASGDVRLETGDEVFVAPNPKQVSITGEVVRPAVYELKPGETLDQLIRYAGGLKTTAAHARVQIARILPVSERQAGGRDRTVIDVLGDPETPNSNAARTALQPLDAVTIFGITDRVRNRLSIVGSVWSPGSIALRSGLRLSEAIALAGGLRPDTYHDEVLINRILPNDQREQISVRLDSLGRPVNDVLLREDDAIRVFSNQEFRTSRNVTLLGARNPVDVPWAQGMTLRDLILLGAGLPDQADALDTVTVSRLEPDLTRRALSVSLRDPSGQLNPAPLAAGDQVRVYSRTQFRPARYVRVGGAVRTPVDIPYAEGMTLRQALLLAGGPEESALLTNVQISRLPDPLQAGKLAEIINVSLDSSYVFERGPDGKYIGPRGVPTKAGGAPEFILKPLDQVNVLRQPEWDLGGTITLTGEVRVPGAYALLRRNETIGEVIERAGGLTDRAFVDGAVYSRTVSVAEIAKRRRLLEQVRKDRAYGIATERLGDKAVGGVTSVAGADASAENRALADALATTDSTSERISLNLARALRDHRSSDNIIVRAGDALDIPIMNPTVSVRGFVGAPGTIAYQPGMHLTGYVDLAGGATANADISHAMVQQPNGLVERYVARHFWPDADPRPLPGSIIIVPPVIGNHSDFSLTQVITTFLGVATTAAAVIAAAKR